MREGWEEKTLVDVTDLITCGVAKRPEYVDSGIPFLSAKNVKNGQVVWRDYKFVSEETHRQLTKHNKPREGDILYTRVGSYGEAAIVDRDCEFSVFVSLTLIKPKAELSNRFLKHYLNSPLVKGIAAKSINGVGVGNLNVGTVRKFPIPLPPLPEQKRIVAILDEAFGAIDRAKEIATQNVSSARELFESYLNRVFTEKGEGWEETWLGDVCDLQNGYAFKSKWYTEDGVRLVRNANVSHGFIDWNTEVKKLPYDQADEYSRFSLDEGDVVLSLDRPVISTGLKAARLGPNDIPSLLLQRVLRITSQRISQEYIFHWLFSRHFLSVIDPGRSLGVPHISSKEVGSVPITFPLSREEQNNIVRNVLQMKESANSLEDMSKGKLEALDELKQSILQKAFTGRLTEKAPELEAVG